MGRGAMPDKRDWAPVQQRLTDSDFERVRRYLEVNCGLKMPVSKKVMLEARLIKRLRALDLGSMEDYCEFLFSAAGLEQELVHMIDVVTTNKTDFFREPQAFEFLTQVGLPALRKRNGNGGSTHLRFWSSACSTGEEPYTLAMVLEEYRRLHPLPRLDYTILASDISTQVLAIAGAGIYGEDRIAPVPAALRQRYLLRSRDATRRQVRIVSELRRHVRFARINLVEPLDIRPQLDAIFCRNVIIYFDRTTQTRLLQRMCDLLVPGGYLVMGHSETLNGIEVAVTSVAPLIYQKVS
jgi:chemotaxis protein methyltransferase CheR